MQHMAEQQRVQTLEARVQLQALETRVQRLGEALAATQAEISLMDDKVRSMCSQMRGQIEQELEQYVTDVCGALEAKVRSKDAEQDVSIARTEAVLAEISGKLQQVDQSQQDSVQLVQQVQDLESLHSELKSEVRQNAHKMTEISRWPQVRNAFKAVGVSQENAHVRTLQEGGVHGLIDHLESGGT
eukprot:COSAG01_NODE_6049_length_3880_cov_7.107643_2_plen_186_part_00